MNARIRNVAQQVFDTPSGIKNVKFNRFLVLLVGLLTLCVTQVWGEEVAIEPSIYEGKGGASGTGGAATNTYQGVTLTSTRAYYTAAHIREYSNGSDGTMTISSTSTITKIVVTCTSNAYATAFSGATPTVGDGTYSTSSTTGTWQPKAGDAAVKSVTFTHTAQTRWSKIVVTLASGCTAPATALSITSAATATVGTPLSLTSTGGNGGTVTWSVTNGTGSATVDGSTLNPVTTGSVTVKAHQDQNGATCEQDAEKVVTISKQATTITLSEAGNESDVAGTYYVGDLYTLPSTTSATCGSKVLVGWSIVQIPTAGAKPVSNYYEKGASVTLGTTNKFYAVFATASAGGAEPSAYTAGATGDYVLAIYNGESWYAIPTNPTVTSGKITGVEITVNTSASSVNYVTTANASGFTWTIANATNGQTISDGTKYLYHSNGGSSGTNLTYNTGTTYTWTIAQESKGLTFQATNGSTVNTRGMLASGTTFGGYALSNEDQNGYYRIQVLPIGGGSTYTDYITECSSDPSVSASVASVTGLDYITGHGPSAAKTFTVSGSNLTANVTVSVSGSDFEISKSENSGYSNSLTFTPTTGSVSAQTVYVRLKSGKTAGNYNSTITVSSTGADDQSVTLSGTVTDPTPVLTVSESSLAFDKVVKNPGSPQQKTFTLSGTDLRGNASLAISGTNASMFSVSPTSVTKNGSGAIAATTITVTYNPTATGSHSATLTVSSTEATSKTVSLSGTCADKYTVTWSVYGDESRTTEVWAGDAVGTLPSTPAGSCVNDGHDYNSFYGWYTSGTTSPAASPAGTKVTTGTTPSGDVTYYAVYKATWTDPGAGTSWQLITDNSTIVAGTYAIISYTSDTRSSYYSWNGMAFNGTITDKKHGAGTSEKFSFSSKGVATSAPTGTCELTLEEVGTPGGKHFVIKNSAGKFLYGGSSGSNLAWNTLTTYNTAVGEKGYWFNNSGNFVFQHGTGATDKIYLRSYNDASNAFRGYTSTSNGTIAFVKKVAGGEVTKYLSSCCTKYAVTISGSIEHGTVTASPTTACDGETVTLTATPAGGYVFDSWNVRDASSNTVTVTDNAFTMPNSAVTVSATFREVPHWNVTWSVNGDDSDVDAFSDGDALVLPADPASSTCPGKVFVGWTATQDYSDPTNAPVDLFTTAGSKKVTGDITYYAVFATSNTPADIVIDGNFNQNPAPYGLPTSGTRTNDTYTIDGQSVQITAPTNILHAYNLYGPYYCMQLVDVSTSAAGRIKFPAIAGYKLVQVRATAGSKSSLAANLSVVNAGGTTVTTGGAAQTFSATTMVWNLTATTANTGYDLYAIGTSSAKTLQFVSVYAKYVSTAAPTYSDYATTCDTRYNIYKVETTGSISVTNGNKENAGQTVRFTVTPNTGYSAGTPTVTGASGSVDVTNNAGTYSFTMPDEDVTIDAGCTCNTYNIVHNFVSHATLGAIGTYIETNNAYKTTKVCGAELADYQFYIRFKNETYRQLYQINLEVTRGGDAWDGYTYENEWFTVPAGELTADINIRVTLTMDEYSATTKTAPETGKATITLYKTNGTAWSNPIPAGQTVYLDAAPITDYVFNNIAGNWAVRKNSNESLNAAEVHGPALAGSNAGRYYFTMPKEDVVVIATVAVGNIDTYIDEMHGTVIDNATTRNTYTVPLLDNKNTGTVQCEEEHLYFIGWTTESSGDPVDNPSSLHDLYPGGVEKIADGTTYYAVWATAVAH